MGTREEITFWHRLHYFRVPLALVPVVSVMLCLPVARRLTSDPSNQALFEKNESYTQYQTFESIFGSDETIIVAVGETDVFNREVLNWTERLCEFSDSLEEVLDIQSLSRVKGMHRESFHLEEETLAGNYLAGREPAEEFAAKINLFREWTNPLFKDGGAFFLTVITLRSNLTSQQKSGTVGKIQGWVKNHAPPFGNVYISGTVVEQNEFVEQIQHDHTLFVPLTFIAILTMIALTHASFRATVYPAAVIVATMISSEACMVLTGHAVNVVTTLVLPVILIVSITDPIHIQSYARHVNRNDSSAHRLRTLFRALGVPCFLTSLTTAIGFLSLTCNRIPAIREFGIYSTIGTVFAYVWGETLAPLFFHAHVKWNKRKSYSSKLQGSAWLAHFVERQRWAVLTATLLLLAGGFFSLMRVPIQTDILKSFPESNYFRMSTEQIQEKAGGVYSLELVIDSPGREDFGKAENLERMIQYQDAISSLPYVMEVHYVTDVLRALDRALRGTAKIGGGDKWPPPRHYLEKYLSGMAESRAFQLSRIRSDDFRHTRMTVDLSVSGTSETVETASRIRALAEKYLPAGWSMTLTGRTYLLAIMSEDLVRNELGSMAIAFVTIAIIMMISLKSWKFGILSAMVNGLPIVITGIFMSCASITFNTATTTVASISFGLIIDNAIHILYQYKKFLIEAPQNIFCRVMSVCVRPLASTTLILASGFGITIFSRMIPTQQFGILMAMVLLAALVANLLVLPSVLLCMNGTKSVV